jgi:hypothetical protein
MLSELQSAAGLQSVRYNQQFRVASPDWMFLLHEFGGQLCGELDR